MSDSKTIDISWLCKGAAWISALIGGSAAGLWLFADPPTLAVLSLTMRPNSAFGVLAAALGLAGLLDSESFLARRGLRVGLPLVVLALSGTTMLGFVLGYEGFSRPLLAYHSMVPTQMPPLAALLLVLLGISLLGAQKEAPIALRNKVPIASMLICSCSTPFVLSALMGRLSGLTLTPSHLMLPGTGLCLSLLSLSLFLLNPGRNITEQVLKNHSGAILVRSLLARCALLILTVAFLDVWLLKFGPLTLEECTALCATFAMIALSSAVYRHGCMVTSTLTVRDMNLVASGQLIEENKMLVKASEHERAKLFSVLKAMTNISIIETDLMGKIVFCSSGSEAMLGYGSREMVGQNLIDLLHCPNELRNRATLLGIPTSFDIFRCLADLGHSDEQEWTYRTRSGDLKPVLVATSAVKDGVGAIIGYLAVARDISLERSRQRERDGFFAIGHELLCITDAEGVFRTVSPSFFRVMGYSPAELIGRPFFDFVHPDDRAGALKITDRVTTELVLDRYENRWRTKNGRYKWVTWDGSAPYGDGLIYASGWDITEDKVRDAGRVQTLMFEQKLIGITSHDLRNPITAISLSADSLLRNKGDVSKVERNSRRIVEACKRAEKLIHDILDFTQARIGAGLRVKRSDCDLGAVLDEIVDETRASHPHRNIVADYVIDKKISIDPDRIKQMVGNLLANSLTYSPSDTPVTLSIDWQAAQVSIEVHNQGPPIPPHVLPSLFQPFKSSDNQAGAEQHSLGLGLFIVQEIVRAHQGTVDVQSSSEAGTTVFVTLPRKTSDISEIKVVERGGEVSDSSIMADFDKYSVQSFSCGAGTSLR